MENGFTMSYTYNIATPATSTVSITAPSSSYVGYTTVTGYNGASAYSAANQNLVSNNGKPILTIPSNEQTVVLEKSATLEVKGNVVINGLDLEERLNVIEKVLQIPSRDVTMEAKHPKLKDLYQAYMNELEKYKTWDRLNGDENVT